MAKNDITKRAIASTVKKMMENKALDRITTTDIISTCGVSRKTFYNHFCDKYDVVNWIFTKEIFDQTLKDLTFDQWQGSSYVLCNYIKENQAFYKNAINAHGQNCFVLYLRNLTEAQLATLCHDVLIQGVLTKDDMDYLADFYYGAFITVFAKWVKNGMKTEPDLFVKRWTILVDNSLEDYIANIGK